MTTKIQNPLTRSIGETVENNTPLILRCINMTAVEEFSAWLTARGYLTDQDGRCVYIWSDDGIAAAVAEAVSEGWTTTTDAKNAAVVWRTSNSKGR